MMLSMAELLSNILIGVLCFAEVMNNMQIAKATSSLPEGVLNGKWNLYQRKIILFSSLLLFESVKYTTSFFVSNFYCKTVEVSGNCSAVPSTAH